MSFLNLRAVFVLLGGILLLSPGKGNKSEGYRAVIRYEDGFLAAGSGGRIDRISVSGKIIKSEKFPCENFNCMLSDNQKVIAAGDSGTILISDEGEIIHTTDGIKWDILDFNRVYSGFYKPCYFTRVLVTENRIALTGVRNDNSPVLLFSNQGEVWTERTLYYTDDQGMSGFLMDSPNDIFYDNSEDQFFLVCSKGKLMKLTSCSQCNKLAVLTEEDLTGISYNENTILIVGGNFFIKAVNMR